METNPNKSLRPRNSIFFVVLTFMLFCINQFSFAQAGATLNFDGSNDYVCVPPIPLLDFGPSVDFTYEAWIKGGSQTNYAGIIAKGSILNTGNFVQLVISTDRIAAECYNTTFGAVGTGNGLIGTTLLNDNNWHHVALVATRSLNNIKLYPLSNKFKYFNAYI
jgi:hypothetical protein